MGRNMCINLMDPSLWSSGVISCHLLRPYRVVVLVAIGVVLPGRGVAIVTAASTIACTISITAAIVMIVASSAVAVMWLMMMSCLLWMLLLLLLLSVICIVVILWGNNSGE